MKIIKLLLDSVALCFISILILTFSLKEADASFPKASFVIHVTGWDRQHSKQDVYNTIDAIAKKEKIQIYKSIVQIKTDSHKMVYSFNSKDKKVKNYQMIKYDELLTKDIRGNYFIVGKDFDANDINQQLQHIGIDSELYSINKLIIFLSIINDKGLIFPIISLLFIYLFYYFYNINMHFKSFAIKKLHGYSFLKIIFEDSKRIILYYCALSTIYSLILFIILLNLNLLDNLWIFTIRFIMAMLCFYCLLFLIRLISYLLYIRLNISQTLKGKKPYNLISTITMFCKICIIYILTLLIVHNIGIFNSLKQIKETEPYWSKLDDYYCLELAPFKYNEAEVADIAKKLHHMINITEKDSLSLLIKTNNLYHPKPTNFTPDNGNVIFINENFIHLYKDILQVHFINQTEPNTIEVLLPPNANHTKKDIQNEFKSWVKFQQNFPNQNKEVKFLSSTENYKMYTFDTRSELKNTFTYNPAIALVNTDDLGDNFYYASVSQGSYLFKDYKKINNYLTQYHLNHIVSGVTNYKSIIWNEIKELNLSYFIVSCSIILSSITLLLITIFDIQQYFDKNQKMLLIRKIHGFGLLKNHYQYFLFSNLIIVSVGACAWLTIKHHLVPSLFLFLLCLQILLQSLYIKKLENTHFIKIKELSS